MGLTGLENWLTGYYKIWLYVLKVSKFHKQIFLFSFAPQNEQNYFSFLPLGSKMSQIKNKGRMFNKTPPT